MWCDWAWDVRTPGAPPQGSRQPLAYIFWPRAVLGEQLLFQNSVCSNPRNVSLASVTCVHRRIVSSFSFFFFF